MCSVRRKKNLERTENSGVITKSPPHPKKKNLYISKWSPVRVSEQVSQIVRRRLRETTSQLGHLSKSNHLSLTDDDNGQPGPGLPPNGAAQHTCRALSQSEHLKEMSPTPSAWVAVISQPAKGSGPPIPPLPGQMGSALRYFHLWLTRRYIWA